MELAGGLCHSRAAPALHTCAAPPLHRALPCHLAPRALPPSPPRDPDVGQVLVLNPRPAAAIHEPVEVWVPPVHYRPLGQTPGNHVAVEGHPSHVALVVLGCRAVGAQVAVGTVGPPWTGSQWGPGAGAGSSALGTIKRGSPGGDQRGGPSQVGTAGGRGRELVAGSWPHLRRCGP